MRFFAFAALLLGATALVAGQSAVPSTDASATQWDYAGKRGPLVWGKLDAAYKTCSQGHQQSPIDIRGAHLNKGLQPIEVHYIAGAVKLENDGRAILVHVNPGSYIVVGGVRYELQQFSFHHPGEDAVKGKLVDMGVELLHKSSDGKAVVIEVRMGEDRGAPNAVLAQLWPLLPKTPGATAKVAEMVNPAGFLPSDRGYWTYMGSLTVPPCTEGVRWFVFEEEISASRDQLRSYTALFRISSRPLQDTHGRRIEANE